MQKNYKKEIKRKTIVATTILLALSIGLGAFLALIGAPTPSPENQTLTYLYAVTGILFSVGVSTTISFEYSDIINDNYYHKLTLDLSYIVHVFLAIFFTATLLFMIGINLKLSLNTSPLFFIKLATFTPFAFQAIASLWMSYIFLQLYKLKRDLNNERRKK